MEARGTVNAFVLAGGNMDSELERRALYPDLRSHPWLLGIHNEWMVLCPWPRQHSHTKSAGASKDTGDTPKIPRSIRKEFEREH